MWFVNDIKENIVNERLRSKNVVKIFEVEENIQKNSTIIEKNKPNPDTNFRMIENEKNFMNIYVHVAELGKENVNDFRKH